MATMKSSTRKQATPAQKEAAQLRRERFRSIVKQIGAMNPEQRAFLASKGVLMTCEGRTLSLGNQMLLALQCPDATVVGGFRQWKAQGRSVRKGEHGHMIWVPLLHGSTDADTDTPQPSDLDGDAKPERLRFLVGTVFSIEQTEAMSSQEVAYADAE